VLDLLRRGPWRRGDAVRVAAILARVVALLLVLGPRGTPIVGMGRRRDGDAAQVAVARRPWRRRGEGDVAGGRARGLGRRRGDVLMHRWTLDGMRPSAWARGRRAGSAGGEGGIWRAEVAQAQRLQRRRGRRGDAGDLGQREAGGRVAIRARCATGRAVGGRRYVGRGALAGLVGHVLVSNQQSGRPITT